MERMLGRSRIPVSPLGLGCWAIGGPFWLEGIQDGWGAVDDVESIQAVRRAIDLGVRFFDTADVYGAGHSEEVLGRALEGRRDAVVVSTKFGYTFEAATKHASGTNASAEYVRSACLESLRRLRTDYIDLYFLHIGSAPPEEAEITALALDDLRNEGLIRAYGWSTDLVDCASLYAARPGCAAVQHDLNVFDDAPELLALCEEHDLASVNRTPLAMGLLSGKFDASSRLSRDDVRGAGHSWVRYFENRRPKPEFLDRLAAVREILTSGGRTLAQGALAWIWARSERTIPIPGFKTVAQAEENARAMELGPLTSAQTGEIDRLLDRRAATTGASPRPAGHVSSWFDHSDAREGIEPSS
jgi:aryl-alcohol dehydrogenase-like predicted oxidoreductase